MLKTLTPQLHNVTWSRGDLEQVCNDCAESFGVKFGKLASPLRAVLSGQTRTPSVFDMMLVLGRDETIKGWKMPRVINSFDLLKILHH